MEISEAGLSIIKHFENLYLKPYLCPAGVPTIGWGTIRYPNGRRVRMSDPAITREQADAYLKHDVTAFENDVMSLLKVVVNQSQFDALVSFAYNVGSDIDQDLLAEGLGDSSLLKYINGGGLRNDFGWKRVMTQKFSQWVWANTKSGRKKLSGLVRRRSCEAYLFCEGKVNFFN